MTALRVASLQSPPGAHVPKRMPSLQPHVSHTRGLHEHKASRRAWQMKHMRSRLLLCGHPGAELWKTLAVCSASGKDQVGQGLAMTCHMAVVPEPV